MPHEFNQHEAYGYGNKTSTLLTGYGEGCSGRAKARSVTPEQLAQLTTPAPQGARHMPVPHIDVYNAITGSAATYGFNVHKVDMAVGGKCPDGNGGHVPDATLFGVMDLSMDEDREGRGEFEDGECGFSIGFRSNNTKKYPVHLIAGLKVFVCDNLSLSTSKDGGIIACRKHTTNISIIDVVEEGFARWVEGLKGYKERLYSLKDRTLSDIEAKAMLWDVFNGKCMPTHMKYMQAVQDTYFTPREAWEDCTPRNEWGLYNSFTRVLSHGVGGKKMEMNTKMEYTGKVGEFFGV